MQDILLTIAIPTFNRAVLLDKCLHSILSQITDEIATRVELIVSDNCSTDNTYPIVRKYNDGSDKIKISYQKNSQNLGPDRNIANCFLAAKGKYVWVFSDDDLIRQGYLALLIDLLDKNNFGNLYLNNIWFAKEFKDDQIPPTSISYDTYDDPLLFVQRVNYWSTFVSGNIVNKSVINVNDAIPKLYDTFLVQLGWIMPGIFSGYKNVFINDQMVACLAENTGGYKLFKVFGLNYNKILNKFLREKLISKKVKEVIKSNLLQTFFPNYINYQRESFSKERPLNILLPIFWGYPRFWTSIFPVLVKNEVKSIIKRK